MDSSKHRSITEINKKSFEKLFNSYYISLCAFAESYLKDKSAAEDAVQEVFVNLWNKQEEISLKDSIRSFLYTSVRNRCLNLIKHKNVVNKHIESELKTSEEERFFFDHVIEEETIRLIQDAVNELPEKCQNIIRLSLSGLKHQEIAEELNISVNTIKTQKALAYKKLRIHLKDVFLLSPFLFEQILK